MLIRSGAILATLLEVIPTIPSILFSGRVLIENYSEIQTILASLSVISLGYGLAITTYFFGCTGNIGVLK